MKRKLVSYNENCQKIGKTHLCDNQKLSFNIRNTSHDCGFMNIEAPTIVGLQYCSTCVRERESKIKHEVV